MARIRHWACPDCGGTFKWFHHPDSEPPPDHCPLCGGNMSGVPDPAFVPQAPAIRDNVTVKAVENTVDAVMQSSEIRTHIAAELTPGASAGDFANLKITDLPDNQRAGDQWRGPSPSLAYMQAKQQYGLGSGFGGAAGQGAMGFAAQVGSGPYPFAGAQTAQQFQRHFAMNAKAMQLRDQTNK